MSQEGDNQTGRPFVTELTGSAVDCRTLTLGWTNDDAMTGRRIPGQPGLSARDGNHGRKAGSNGTVGRCFGLGADVDCQSLPVRLADQRQILAKVQAVVSVGVPSPAVVRSD
jgi:hypothetical protein